MFGALLLASMLCLDKPIPPVVKWEGWFSFSGLHDPERKIIVRDCAPVFANEYTSNSRAKFCETAGSINRRPDFCFTESAKTFEQCQYALEKRTEWYFYYGEIIYMYPEDYEKVGERYDGVPEPNRVSGTRYHQRDSLCAP